MDADQLVVLEHRDREQRPGAAEFGGVRDAGSSCGIRRRDRATAYDCLARDRRAGRCRSRPGCVDHAPLHGIRPASVARASPACERRRHQQTDRRTWLRKCASHSPASPRTPAQIAGRTGDDLEHLGGRGLLLQRFGEIVGALAQFAEQPRVLDGDHGLGGEVRAPARSACR